MNFDYFDQIWQEGEIYKGTHKEEKRNLWDKRAEGFNRHGSDERRDKIIGLLTERQMLCKDSTVLDIGCGPGKFVLEFAQRAKSVVGVDISPKMLQYAAENVAALNLDNTEFRELDWEKADLTALNWQKKFSLVTGIMSPAFWNRNSLEKMLEASKEYCLITHFVERQDSVGDVLKKDILGRDVVDEYGNRALYCSFNILWLYKLFPEVVYFDLKKESAQPLEEVYQSYLAKFEMRGVLTAKQKTDILDFLKDKAEGGIIKEKTTSKIACIFWKNN
jgi:SAM-dependent methyltransferase